MNNEKLIELVRQYSVLYDFSHSKYMDYSLKRKIWNKIGKELNTDGSSCKARWKNVRDIYRKSLKKTITKSRPIDKNKTKLYKYSEQLSFMDRYFHERDTKGNFENQEDEEVRELNDTMSTHDLHYEPKKEIIEDDTEEASLSVLSDEIQSQPSPPTFKIENINISTISTRQNSTIVGPHETVAAKLMDYGINENEIQAPSLSQHPVDTFLAGVSCTLKTLNPYYLNLAKTEIFNTAQKYEMKMLTAQHLNKDISMTQHM